MIKKLIPFAFLLIIFPNHHVLFAQDVDFSQLKVKPVPNTEHVCTLDPTDTSTHFHIAPSQEMRNKMKQTESIFEIDYRVRQGSSCGNATWPQQAREAFEFALDIWSLHVRSDVNLRIDAVWAELEGNTLGSAGPTRVAQLPDVGESNTWYAIGQLTAMSGRPIRNQIDNLNHDIIVNVNCSFDNWYFGIDANTPTNQVDFVTVLLHEIGHGIGFFGTMSVPVDEDQEVTEEIGGWGLGDPPAPIIFDRFAIDGDGIDLLNQNVYQNPSLQLYNSLTGNRGGVFFNGEDALLTLADESFTQAKLYTPQEWRAGSSFSHVDQDTFTGTVNTLMRPRIDRASAVHTPGPLFCGMLSDMGWPLGVGCLSFLAADAVIALNERSFNFGVINEGESSTRTITISSDTESVETLSGTISVDGRQFSVEGNTNFELEPGQSTNLTLRYTPDSNQIHDGEIRLFHNARNEQAPIILPLVGEALERDQIVQLDQSYPNPVVPTNPAPRIPYALSQDSDVKLDLYTVSGQHIRSLVNETQTSGRYEAEVQTEGLASGIYIYRIIVDNTARTGKLMLIQ